uniref:Uncharacterized protein n=1 Tax=Opuntia streptacantha TaxID=393608 RepID=A0A7C9CYS4_OPUST
MPSEAWMSSARDCTTLLAKGISKPAYLGTVVYLCKNASNNSSSSKSKFETHLNSTFLAISSSITAITCSGSFFLRAATRASLCLNFFNSLSCSANFTFLGLKIKYSPSLGFSFCPR